MKAVEEYPKLCPEDSAFLANILRETESLLRDYITTQLHDKKFGNKDVEEILDKVFDTALVRFDKLRSCQNPHGWLVLVAKNKLKNYYRKNGRLESLEGKKTLPSLDTEIDIGLEELFSEKIRPADRDLLNRRFVNRDEPKEIAADLHLKEGTLRKRLRKAEAAMRHILKINRKNKK